jgi:hypothetical protein
LIYVKNYFDLQTQSLFDLDVRKMFWNAISKQVVARWSKYDKSIENLVCVFNLQLLSHIG